MYLYFLLVLLSTQLKLFKMSGKKCEICQKTAYPLEGYTLNLTVGERTYHKACFKCATCQQTLNLKNYKAVEGAIYCSVHAPKPKGSVIVDTPVSQTAMNAPKKQSGVQGIHKGDSRTAPKSSADFTVNQVGDQSTENNPDNSTISYEQHGADQSTENNPDNSTIAYDQHEQDQSRE